MEHFQNVLITSAGRRVTLLQKFAEALASRGGSVIAGDMSSLAPALYFTQRQLMLPPVRNEEYIPFLLDAVSKNEIRALVPTIDPELPILSAHREAFASRGCELLVSSPQFNAITADKWLTACEFDSLGIATPRSWLPEGLGLCSGDEPLHSAAQSAELIAPLPDELFIKPRDGSASQNVFRIRKEQLPEYARRVPNAIIQEELKGKEITVDALISSDGTPLHYVPRQRIRTLAGESITGVTVSDYEIAGLEQWCEKTLRACAELGARWAITLQGFSTTRGMVLTEINARFGGGVPLAFAAGGDYPEMILRMLDGEKLAPRLGQYRRGLTFMRYMTEVFTERLLW